MLTLISFSESRITLGSFSIKWCSGPISFHPKSSIVPRIEFWAGTVEIRLSRAASAILKATEKKYSYLVYI